jgi:hypothetical protein
MQTDFRVENHGTIFLFTATNTDALEHLRNNVSEEAQWLGNSLAVEHRYAVDLAAALQAEGFTVS